VTPEELRALCNLLNDDRGTGGQSKLARLVPCNPRTIRRMLAGQMAIRPLVAARIRLVVRRGKKANQP
jgi:hypothetical protein